MLKIEIKIIIIITMLLVVMLYGWQMYQQLSYDRLNYSADIYRYTLPQSKNTIHITRIRSLSQLYEYDNNFRKVIEPVKWKLSLPIIINEQANGSSLILNKLNYSQYTDFQRKIELLSKYPLKEEKYKEVDIYTYPISSTEFASYTNINGILAISSNYSLIKDFIDKKQDRNFFTNINPKHAKAIEYFRIRTPFGISYRIDNKTFLTLQGETKDDNSIELAGNVYSDINPNSEDTTSYAYKIYLPSNFCISYDTTYTSDKSRNIKITLNNINQ